MGTRQDRRGARGRGAAVVAVEALEARALLTSGGAVTQIATLPAGFSAGPMVSSGSNLWYAEAGRSGGPALAKQSATGARTDVPLPAADANDFISAVAADSSGDIWYALAPSSPQAAGQPSGKVGMLTPAGTFAEFALPYATETPGAAAFGGDGNLYVAVSGGPNGPALARISPTGAASEVPIPGAAGPVTWLTRGPDGSLWFVDGTRIGRMTVAGAVTEFPMPTPSGGVAVDLSHAQLTAGGDGNIWFLGLGGVSKITPAGAVTTIASPGSTITALTASSDGSLWLAVLPPASSTVGSTPGEVVIRMTTDGKTTLLPDHIDPSANVEAMTPGENAVWLNEAGASVAMINVAAVPTVTPQMITPTTPKAVSTDSHKVFAGPIVSFNANYEGSQASDFTATINYGDGYTGTGAVVVDPNGGYDVVGYDAYNLPVGTQVKVSVDVTGPQGSTDEIYGIVTIAGPQTTTAAKAAKTHVVHASTAKAAHPKTTVTRPRATKTKS